MRRKLTTSWPGVSRVRPKVGTVMAGPGVDPAAELRSPSVFDVFPTLMYLRGLPLEEGLRGRVLREAFDETVTGTHPVCTTTGYGPRELPENPIDRSSPLDRELLERLRALGYVG